jgi:hypothetical protein
MAELWIRNMLLAGACVPLTFTTPALAQQAPDPVTLWQGLAYGMTPEEAVPAVERVEGVKRVKLLQERKSNPGRRLDINYQPSKIPIADLPFELGPMFEGGRLSKVALAARNQCGASAMEVFQQLAPAISAKYAAPLTAPQTLSERDIRDAERSSLTSGEPTSISLAFASDELAVLWIFKIKAESRPPYPTNYSKLGNSMWQLANLQYEQRREECGGTGDRRMDVVLIYMPRAAYDAAVNDAVAAERDKADRIAEQL